MEYVGYLEFEKIKLKIEAEDENIIGINFVDEILIENKNEAIDKCKEELCEYFLGKRKVFTIKIKLIKGTDFQKSVWEALKQLPYGTTCSYKDIAKKIKNEKAYRAVGSANNKNPIPIIIPCHRVIGNNKSLTGYAGGLEIKKKLLDIELQ